MRPPLLVSRSTSASVIRCAPPTGTGQPTSWPSIASSHPYTADPASSGDRSVCRAQEGEAAADRRERVEERLEEGGRDAAPFRVGAVPALAVAGGEGLHRLRRL